MLPTIKRECCRKHASATKFGEENFGGSSATSVHTLPADNKVVDGQLGGGKLLAEPANSGKIVISIQT